MKKLTNYYSPVQNSKFEKHVFRNIKPKKGENLSKFLSRVRQQASKCLFGKTLEEFRKNNVKDELSDSWLREN